MALSNKWWILCAVSLSYLATFGSCRRHWEDGAPPEPPIFNELCAQKEDPGPCKAIKERYFFNTETGNCERFEYGGCAGNDNNFHTLEACEETCVVSADKDPCHLPEAPGPCRGLVTRYFFDTTTQACMRFFYGGCYGNANNFRSMDECQSRCQNPVKPTKAPEVHTQPPRRAFVVQPTEVVDLKPTDLCSMPVETGDCDGAEKRFAYNPGTRRCHMFRYSGCGGNENNFRSRRECSIKCARRRKTHGRRMIRIRKKNLDIIQRSV
ncbi:tissue factor pathway inhibitor a [Xyrichtys novacula]|uniref:Tissue factor pathway inhibitor n=1 Tax=Xyrichtys novacula TaxID=13765 RepID=A0AAV1GYM5_XYRNO|nr:tissue factor pathway inhibitor a [Xyrichtys novacula]